MACPSTFGNAEFVQAFNRRSADGKVPLLGSIEVTRRCNLRCEHCYLGHRDGQAELDAGTLLGLTDELADAGCLYLVLTGGDPLLHPEFPTIYRHMRERGMVVTLFTNGTTVTDATLAVLRHHPPHEVEVSIHGATPGTHDGVTGMPGSFEACWGGIDRLAGAGLRVTLKTMLTSANRGEFHAMEALAGARGMRFRFDTALFPRWDGDRAPLDRRIPAEEAVDLEFADPTRARGWIEFDRRTRAWKTGDELFQCGAGLTAFHVDATGHLRPCLMVHRISVPLVPGSFAEAWQAVGNAVGGRRSGGASACRSCRAQFVCGYCPGQFDLETGDDETVSDYLCSLGHSRLRKISDHDAAACECAR
jgi:radical SAM protein with 4Fe4S-binding SPASM domain